MRKNRVRLTESQLHRVIKESVKKVLREMDDLDREEAERRQRIERENALYTGKQEGDYWENYHNHCGYGNSRFGTSDNDGSDRINRL